MSNELCYLLFIYFRRFKDLSGGRGYNFLPSLKCQGDKFPHYNYATIYTRKRPSAHNYCCNQLNTGIPTILTSDGFASDSDKGRESN